MNTIEAQKQEQIKATRNTTSKEPKLSGSALTLAKMQLWIKFTPFPYIKLLSEMSDDEIRRERKVKSHIWILREIRKLDKDTYQAHYHGETIFTEIIGKGLFWLIRDIKVPHTRNSIYIA